MSKTFGFGFLLIIARGLYIPALASFSIFRCSGGSPSGTSVAAVGVVHITVGIGFIDIV
jgi:hypothetical protein